MADYLYPKDISEYVIEIDGKDFSNIVSQVEIYQDIFFPVWTATLLVRDTQNQLMNLPIKTGSEVTITLGTKAPGLEGDVTFEFIISRIGEKELLKEQDYGYELGLMSKEFFLDQKVRVSEAMDGTADAIADKIMGDTGVGVIDRKTAAKQPYSFIVPNTSPFTAIEMLASIARKDAADFVFYQCDKGGKFAFESVEAMFNNNSGTTLYQVNPNDREGGQGEVDKAFFNIEQFSFINHFDSVSNYMRGTFGNKIIAHDIINKKIVETEYTYSEDASSDDTMKPFSSDMFTDAALSSISYNPMHPDMFDGGKSVNDFADKWRTSRKSHMMKLETNRLVVDIPGHAKMYDHIGKMIMIELPSHEDLSKEKEDKYLSGEWLVTAIRHVATSEEYHLIVELGKKRLKNAL